MITGALLAQWLFLSEVFDSAAIDWAFVAIAAIGGVLLCVAGNLLNDWHDFAWDREFRSERALPSGDFRPATFLALGSTALLLGVVVMFFLDVRAGFVAMAIAAFVVIYTRCHKRTVWAVVPLALCRGLLPVMGAFAVAGSAFANGYFIVVIVGHGLGLFLWVCGLSLDARGESNNDHGLPSAAWPVILAGPLVVFLVHAAHGRSEWFAVMPVCVWLILVRGPFRHSAKHRVSALLAGMPLIDFLAVSTVWAATPGAPHKILWVPILAFAIGRYSQRHAAAT